MNFLIKHLKNVELFLLSESTQQFRVINNVSCHHLMATLVNVRGRDRTSQEGENSFGPPKGRTAQARLSRRSSNIREHAREDGEHGCLQKNCNLSSFSNWIFTQSHM